MGRDFWYGRGFWETAFLFNLVLTRRSFSEVLKKCCLLQNFLPLFTIFHDSKSIVLVKFDESEQQKSLLIPSMLVFTTTFSIDSLDVLCQ